MRGGGGEGIVLGIHARILKKVRLKEHITNNKKIFNKLFTLFKFTKFFNSQPFLSYTMLNITIF